MKTNQITASDLKPLAIMPQGLDNQFVPNNHLKKILNSKGELSRTSVRKEINSAINAEFLRSLIFGEQLVLNRAFIINTPEVYQYFQNPSIERDTFIELIKSKSIIPWLFNEHALNEKPVFSVDNDGWIAVCKLLDDYKEIPCLRFSWDDNENARQINRLTLAFTKYILSMPTVSDKIAKDFIANDFGVTKENEGEFRKKIGEVAKFVIDEIEETDTSYITRNRLYETFVCIDGSDIPSGYYDVNKPFSLPLKLLFDLKYQVNLPDAFNIQSLTSRDLPSRTSLHELDMALGNNQSAVLLDIAELMGSLSFSSIQSCFWLRSINQLSLTDVKEARESDEWKNLMSISSSLNSEAQTAVETGTISDSLDFSDFWKAYIAYQEKLSGMVDSALLEEVKPQAYVQIRMGDIVFNVNPIEKIVDVAGNANSLRDLDSPFETGILVGGRGRKEIDLGYNFEFLRTKIQGAQFQFENIIRQLKSEGYQINKTKFIPPSKESSITDSADFFGLRRAENG